MLLTIAGRARQSQAMQQEGRVLIAESRNVQISIRAILPFESNLTVR